MRIILVGRELPSGCVRLTALPRLPLETPFPSLRPSTGVSRGGVFRSLTTGNRGLDVPRTSAAALHQAILLPWTPSPPLSPAPPGSSLPQLISLFITITWSWGLVLFWTLHILSPASSEHAMLWKAQSTALAGGHLEMAVPFLPPWTREDRSRAVQVCVPCPCVPSELALKAAGLGAGPWMQARPLWAQEACLYCSPAGAWGPQAPSHSNDQGGWRQRVLDE